jgi:hypothetical protein
VNKKEVEISSETLYLTYSRDENIVLNKTFTNMSCFLEFLQTDAKRYKLPVPGGHLLMERGP